MAVQRLYCTGNGLVAYTRTPRELEVAEAAVPEGLETVRPVVDSAGEDSP